MIGPSKTVGFAKFSSNFTILAALCLGGYVRLVLSIFYKAVSESRVFATHRKFWTTIFFVSFYKWHLLESGRIYAISPSPVLTIHHPSLVFRKVVYDGHYTSFPCIFTRVPKEGPEPTNQNNLTMCCHWFYLPVKSCTIFPPPRNGALVCGTVSGDLRSCSAFCETGADFEFNPPLVYYCSAGQWKYWNIPGIKLQNAPWPNCSGKISRSINCFF